MQHNGLFGYNIHGEAENQLGKGGSRTILFNHLDTAKPKHLLVISRFDLVQDLAKRYPQTTIHVRYYPDGYKDFITEDGNYKITPKFWLDKVQKDWKFLNSVGIRNVSFYTMNEPRNLIHVSRWHNELIKLNNQVQYRIPLTLINFGHYEPSELVWFKDTFKLISENPQLYILGIHEYFTALPSSGMPELDSSRNPFFPIPYEKWDRRENATRYHVGRHQFILKFCDDNKINRPRLVVTEFGADRLDEGGNWVGQWLNSLILTKPYTNIRGWLSCVNQWRFWFRDWSLEETYFYMCQYLGVRVYESNYLDKPRNIEGVLFFSWWNSGQIGTAEDWTQFRVDQHPIFLNFISLYNQGKRFLLENDEPVFTNPSKDDSRWKIYKTKGKLDLTPIYNFPNAEILGYINQEYKEHKFITFDNMSDNEKEASGGNWFLIFAGDTIGWIKTNDFEVYKEPPKPDLTNLISLVDSSISELQNVRNNLITLKQELEKL